MSTLEHQYLDIGIRFGEHTAISALAEWLMVDNPATQLAAMPAVMDNPARLTASSLTSEHVGARVSFTRVGAAGAAARISGLLCGIHRAVRANGMPGYLLLVRGEEHGPLAPHHEVVVTLTWRSPRARAIARRKDLAA